MNFVKFKENLTEELKLNAAAQVAFLRESTVRSMYSESINKIVPGDLLESSVLQKLSEAHSDAHSEAYELITHADNNENMHRQKKAFIKNMETKMKRKTGNVYDHSKAPALWKHYADRVSQHYAKENNARRNGTSHAFSPEARNIAAKHFADYHHDALVNGDISSEKF